MTKTHYFQGNKLYYLKEVLPYIKLKNPSLQIPECWQTGGSLNEKVRADFGLVPTWTNGKTGRHHREKWSGAQMYQIAVWLVGEIRAGHIKRRNSLTPIEALASGKLTTEGLVPEPIGPVEVMTAPSIEIEPMQVSSKEELEKALQGAADELVNSFKNFMQQIIDAYIGG